MMASNNNNNEGSSVDPETVELFMEGSSSFKNGPPQNIQAESLTQNESPQPTVFPATDASSRNSLSTSDLEADAVPCTPDTPAPLSSSLSPQLNPGTTYSFQQDSRHLPPGSDHHAVPGEGEPVSVTTSPSAQSTVEPNPRPPLVGSPDLSPDPRAVPSQTTGSPVGQQAEQEASSNKSSIDEESSLDSLMSARAQPQTYDAVIICHEEDREEVRVVKESLNKLVLYDGAAARVATEDDNASLGKQEIEYFDDWLTRAELVFLYATKKFCKDLQCNYKTGVAITDSFFCQLCKKEYVIPIFLENKYKAAYMTPSMRAIKGIDYFNCQWEKIEPTFKSNLDRARERSKERDLPKEMKDLKLED